MFLRALPLVFVLVGMVLYAVLGGADFGAGVWQLLAGRGTRATHLRAHAHHSMGPLWEANHVWLIFVLTVFWTAYPRAFGSIASTLAVPLFAAAIGIVFRGAAYALRSGATGDREAGAIDTIFGLSSILTPFALGAAAGAIATGRVPVGNAAGPLISSWLNWPCAVIGALAVTNGAYLAAVYLAADAARAGEADLENAYRARALAAGLVAGAMAVAGLLVLDADDHRFFHLLVSDDALVAVSASVAAGLATLGLVHARRYEAARYSAAAAVGAVIAGWALARWPVILPGLRIAHAAAGHDSLVAITIAVIAGGTVLFPSLVLLFRLTLGGRLQESDEGWSEPGAAGAESPGGGSPALMGRAAAASFIAGLGLLTFADSAWAHAIGLAALAGFALTAFLAVVRTALAE